MKHTKLVAIVTLLLVGAGGVAAQSLGDYARAARKNKTEPTTASRHYDNDNLPTDEKLSVVGPPPTAESSPRGSNNAMVATTAQSGTTPGAPAPGASASDRQKAADEWQKKIDMQQEKIDALNHELDLDQREARLRAAKMYSDVGARLQNATEKEDAAGKSDMDAKQKALDAAKQELTDLQEQARKAGVREKDNDAGKDISKDATKDTDK